VRRALTLLLAACYDPPDLPVVPYETPVLGQDEDDLIQVCAPEVEARVGCVIDGDTVDLNGCREDAWDRIRLLGIDAPETEKPGQETECGADAAWAELRRIATGRAVTVAFDAECIEAGPGDRTLGYLWLEQDEAIAVLGEAWTRETLRVQREDDDPEARVLLNAYLLVRGYVRRFDESWVEPLRHERTMIFAERAAQLRGLGVWSACPE
jgi:endonuclease YncB( thermonuclease family)